jgi:hypothetical protein
LKEKRSWRRKKRNGKEFHLIIPLIESIEIIDNEVLDE